MSKEKTKEGSRVQPLIGCDPEVFIQTDEGRLVPAVDMIPGTKFNPFKVDGGAIQVDGTALEFNIDPAASESEFLNNINKVMSVLSERALGYDKEENRNPNHKLKFAILPTAHYDPATFAGIPTRALEIGCDPDYNAYSEKQNPKPKMESCVRMAGGHIHVGWTSDESLHDPAHFKICCNIARQLDIALFVPSLLWDQDDERRYAYGQPGSFRPKKYGMEYRTLSNRWLACPDITRWIYQQTEWAVKEYFKTDGLLLYKVHEVSEEPERLLNDLFIKGAPVFPWYSKILTKTNGISSKEKNVCC